MSKSVFPDPIYLSGALRSPIGKFGGSLVRFSAGQLAGRVLKEARTRFQTAEPDLVFLGHARQAGGGPNTARQATIFSGLSEKVPAITVNQACASGMTAIISGAEKIALGRAKSVWAGGVESMSNTPYLLPKARWGVRLGHDQVVDGMYQDGFHCPMADMVMGATVENFIAKEQKISRKEQDEFALRSQQLAEKAWASGDFKKETFEIEGHKKISALWEDEHRRGSTSLEKLGKLPPVFDAENGSVTAGNSSGITDGAAFVHLGLEAKGAAAEILDYEMVALDPKLMGMGPVPATQALLKRQGLQASEIEAVEINEAFAAQVIACQKELKFPEEKLNAWGGAIAIGHPIGATGARIMVTLMNRLSGKKDALGIATLCVSGGQGVSVLLRSL